LETLYREAHGDVFRDFLGVQFGFTFGQRRGDRDAGKVKISFTPDEEAKITA
jgi:hypothetical protein